MLHHSIQSQMTQMVTLTEGIQQLENQWKCTLLELSEKAKTDGDKTISMIIVSNVSPHLNVVDCSDYKKYKYHLNSKGISLKDAIQQLESRWEQNIEHLKRIAEDDPDLTKIVKVYVTNWTTGFVISFNADGSDCCDRCWALDYNWNTQ